MVKVSAGSQTSHDGKKDRVGIRLEAVCDSQVQCSRWEEGGTKTSGEVDLEKEKTKTGGSPPMANGRPALGPCSLTL